MKPLMPLDEAPAEILDLACEVMFGSPPDPSDDREGMARVLVHLLPAVERAIREKAAKEIERVADEWGDGSSWDGGMSRAAEIVRGES